MCEVFFKIEWWQAILSTRLCMNEHEVKVFETIFFQDFRVLARHLKNGFTHLITGIIERLFGQ